MNYRITNGNILIQTEDGFAVEKTDLFIKEDMICHIGGDVPFDVSGFEVVDAKDKLVMPGLINMHTHAYMTAMRNYADDVDFDEWLFKRIMPVEDNLAPEDAYWTSLLGCMEMIRTGTTCFLDMHMFQGQSCKAVNETGMRAFIGRGLVGDDLYKDGYGRFKEALDEKEEYESDRIKFVLSPHAIYSCSPLLLEQVAGEAQKRGMLKQIHLSESELEVENALKQYGKTPVELLADIGFLDRDTILAHCVQMRGEDITLIKNSGSTVVTNPASNAKLGNGFAPIAEMSEKGVNICLGTDGTASNNTLNMFREMGLMALLHKAVNRDSVFPSADFVIGSSTVNAAKALNMEGKIGVVKEGAYADLIFVDLNRVSLFPNNNIISSLCYSANGSEVESVMIHGKFVMKNNELLTVDTERVYYEVNRIVANRL